MNGWGARYDIRHQQGKDFYPSRLYGFEESGKRSVGNDRAANGRGAVQRERIPILQPGAEAAEGAVVGQERVLAGPEEAGTRQVPVAWNGRGSEGDKRGRVINAAGGDRFFQGA